MGGGEAEWMSLLMRPTKEMMGSDGRSPAGTSYCRGVNSALALGGVFCSYRQHNQNSLWEHEVMIHSMCSDVRHQPHSRTSDTMWHVAWWAALDGFGMSLFGFCLFRCW